MQKLFVKLNSHLEHLEATEFTNHFQEYNAEATEKFWDNLFEDVTAKAIGANENSD